MSKEIIVTEGVTVSFGDFQALKGIDVTIKQGEIMIILGPSGSGKSTLLNIIGTLDQPSGGEVRVDGRELSAFSPWDAAAFRNQTVGFIFQAHHLLPQCTVRENVMVPALAGHGGLSGDALRRRAGE